MCLLPLLPRARCIPLLHSRRRGPRLSFQQLQQIHAHIIATGLSNHNASALGLLVDSYFASSSPHSLALARLVYTHAANPNVFLWNVMIRGCPPAEGLSVYAGGDTRGLVPDESTLVFALGACARMMGLREGMQVHGRVLKSGFDALVTVQTTVVHCYACCKDVALARRMFDEMPVRTSVSWNAMINGYCSERCHAEEAVYLFREMMLLDDDERPTEVSLVSLLSACSHVGVLATGACVHGYMQKVIAAVEDVFMGTALVDMYLKCGCLSSAVRLFEAMSERNVLTWTAMIAGQAMHGQGKEALKLLEKMESANIKPNAVTFTCVLWACCHGGLIEEGLHLFRSMVNKFGVRPQIQHYGCVVDLLGRVGHLEEAHKFLLEMPLEPDILMWRSLLSACRFHGNVELGEKVGKHLLELEKQRRPDLVMETPSCQDYVALSNIYASANRWEDVVYVREKMGSIGVQNKPGKSSIQLN